jgi:drug/metabolite transporter (DMT)-like permease
MQSMNPGTWVKSKGLAYVGLLVTAAIYISYLIATTGLKITDPSYAPIIEPFPIAIVLLLFAVATLLSGKPSDSTNST